MITVPILKTPKLVPVFPITVHRNWTKLSYFSANTRPKPPGNPPHLLPNCCRDHMQNMSCSILCFFKKQNYTNGAHLTQNLIPTTHYIYKYIGFSKTGFQLHLGLTYRLNRVGRTCWKSLANYLLRLCSSDPVR